MFSAVSSDMNVTTQMTRRIIWTITLLQLQDGWLANQHDLDPYLVHGKTSLRCLYLQVVNIHRRKMAFHSFSAVSYVRKTYRTTCRKVLIVVRWRSLLNSREWSKREKGGRWNRKTHILFVIKTIDNQTAAVDSPLAGFLQSSVTHAIRRESV